MWITKTYRSLGAEIGIWPTQESTSQLDALACGLPIIINENTGTPENKRMWIII